MAETKQQVRKISWWKELSHIRVQDGEWHFVKSGTKVIKSAIGLLAIGILALIAAAFMLKIFGTKVHSERLTAEVLAVFLGLGTIVGTLLGYLQKNYTTHKEKAVATKEETAQSGIDAALGAE